MITPSKFIIQKASPARKFVTSLDKAGAILPVLLLEGAVTGGRTYQAYKRDGFVEARERVTEESLGAIFWLFGATMFGKLFAKIGRAVNKNIPKDMPAVGRDEVRTPFNNYIKDIAKNLNFNHEEILKRKNSLAKYSVSKTIASLITACLFIGYVVPKMNQAITVHIFGKRNKNKVDNSPENEKNKTTLNSSPVGSAKGISINAVENFKAKKDTLGVNFDSTINAKNNSKPSFGKINADSLLRIVQNFEENDVWKLLGTDVGTVSGRTLNARNNDERVEIMFRDVVSIYFYCFSMPHIVAFMNRKDTLKGLNTKLNPMSAMDVHNHLINKMRATGLGVEEITDASGKKVKDVFGKVPLKTFEKFAMGEELDKNLYEKFFAPVPKPAEKKVFFGLIDRTPKPDLRVIKLSEFEAKVDAFAPEDKKAQLKDLGRRMASLMQPEKCFKEPEVHFAELANKTKQEVSELSSKILTETQVEDILRGGAMREPEFLSEALNNIFKPKFNSTEKPLTNAYKYISQRDIDKRRQQMLDYVQAILNDAKESGVVTAKRMLELNKRNMVKNGLFMGLAMGVSALFLSTIIPKIQYYITFLRTGKNSFPGVENLNQGK